MQKNQSIGADQKERGRWNAYLVGAGLGVLSWLAFAVVNTPLGISTPISSAASLCAVPVMGSEAVAANAYWTKFPFKWDYHMLFLVGTFLGSLASVLASRTFRLEAVPKAWAERFGSAKGPGCSQLSWADCKISDLKQIMALGVMATPALAINGSIKISGKVPSVQEVKTLLQQAAG